MNPLKMFLCPSKEKSFHLIPILSGSGGGASGAGVTVPGCSGSRSGSAVQAESGQPASHPEVDPHAEKAVESADG